MENDEDADITSSVISRNDLQKVCRICLTELSETAYDLKSTPDLANLVLILNSIEILSSKDVNWLEKYPPKICRECFDKFKEFQKFRCKIMESTHLIEKILKTPETCIANHNQNDGQDENSLHFSEYTSELSFVKPSDVLEPEYLEPIADTSASIFNIYHTEVKFEEEELRIFDHSEHQSAVSSQAQNNEKSETNRSKKHTRNTLKCPYCNKIAYKEECLKAHIRVAHEGCKKPFACSECSKSFVVLQSLRGHILKKHPTQTLDTHSDNPFLAHNETATNNSNEVPVLQEQQLTTDSENGHRCGQCAKTYGSKKALRNHLKRHSKTMKYICKTCGVGKITNLELLSHMRVHSNEEMEKFKCPLCPQMFSRKNAISKHVKVIHQGQKDFKCSHCSRSFATKHTKNNHERSRHSSKTFQCNICQKGFAEAGRFKTHMQNHKIVRKFVCPLCSKRFLSMKNLIDHQPRHLSEKPFICPICSRGFFNLKDLELHTKSHENNNLDASTRRRSQRVKTGIVSK